MSEVRDRFVLHPEFACSTTRKVIWQHWLQAKDTLKSLVPVHAAWLGGSFTSAKLDPDDLDVVFVVNGAATNAVANPAALQALVLFAKSGLRALRGWRLDTFVLGRRGRHGDLGRLDAICHMSGTYPEGKPVAASSVAMS